MRKAPLKADVSAAPCSAAVTTGLSVSIAEIADVEPDCLAVRPDGANLQISLDVRIGHQPGAYGRHIPIDRLSGNADVDSRARLLTGLTAEGDPASVDGLQQLPQRVDRLHKALISRVDLGEAIGVVAQVPAQLPDGIGLSLNSVIVHAYGPDRRIECTTAVDLE